MKVALGGIFHETNTFSALRTSWREFEAKSLVRGEEILAKFAGTRTTIGGVIDAAKDYGLELIPLLYAEATPGGLIVDETFEQITEEICRRIGELPDLDGVIMVLHGAMVTEKKQDAEGYLLQKVRSKIGPDIPMVCTTDFHANISAEMVNTTQCIVGYDTYPHVDYYERAYDAVQILWSTIKTRVKLTTVISKPLLMPVTQKLLTETLPMKAIMELAHEMEKKPGVVNVTVAGGFAYADVECAGMSVLVTTNNDPVLAKRLAGKLTEKIYSYLDDFKFINRTVAEGVTLAKQSKEFPVVLVDSSDNVGGGSSGDGTAILAEMLKQGLDSALVIIKDPEVVDLAHSVGVGNKIAALVGGKTDDFHGEPVYIEGVVEKLSDGTYRSERTGEPLCMGKTAVVKTAGIDLVLTTERVPAFDLAAPRSLGIEPSAMKYIVVKGAIQWKESYGRIAKSSIEMDAPGVTSSNLERFPYKNVRRPIFPLDEIKGVVV